MLEKTIKRKNYVNTFADLPLLPALKKNLDTLGFTQPTEIQAKAIPLLLNAKHDVHAQAQTGTGKTLAFGIPLLHAVDPSIRGVQGLVIAPTRELVLQIYESLREVSRQTGITMEAVYGGMPINRQIANIQRGAQIIIGTPGRLNDHLRRKTLTLKHLKVLVLDEADIMLDMGFKEEIDSILELAPSDRQIWLFSATVGGGIKQLIKSHMHDVLTIKAASKEVVTPQVKQYFCIAPMNKRVEVTARFIEAAPDFYGIIFCQTKVLTTEVTEQLVSRGFKVNCLHGDMRQALRNQVIKGFKNKDFTILVATDVAARGIDVSDLTHVVNFSIPMEHENYIHRIGRTGRAGKEGIAIALISHSEVYRLRRLEKIAHVKLEEMSPPPLDTIIATKMGAVSDFIEQAKKPDIRLSPVHTALKELITSFSEEEIRQSLAIALQDKFFKDIVHEDLGNVKTRGGDGLIPQEICLGLGQENGLEEDAVRDYLATTCKVTPQEIRKVRVLRNKTFIAIPENRLHECMDAMRANPIVEQKYKMYLVEDLYQNKDAGFEDRPRRSGRFNDRRRDKRRDGGYRGKR